MAFQVKGGTKEQWQQAQALFRANIPGAAYHHTARKWHIHFDLDSYEILRTIFRQNLYIDPALEAWYRREKIRQKILASLANAHDASLPTVETTLPILSAALRPYQRAGIRYIAKAKNCLVADEPRLGKTLETIGGLYEGGLSGPVLIIAPKTALRNTWEKELKKWQPAPIYVADGTRKNRERVIEEFAFADGIRWLVVNPDMAAYELDKSHKATDYLRPTNNIEKACHCDAHETWHNHYKHSYEILHLIYYDAVVVDECHKGAIRNHDTITARGISSLTSDRRIALSGTPMTGMLPDLWGTLHWIDPHEYASKWQWVTKWGQEEYDDYGNKTYKKLQKAKQLRFFQSLSPIILRRTKREVRPELPTPQIETIWCEMDGKQKKQYKEMQETGIATLLTQEVTQTSILAEFTRLKQFAISFFGDNLIPHAPSCKLDAVFELLEERGIFYDEPGEKVVIFSQFAKVVHFISDSLQREKVGCAVLTGETKSQERQRIVQQFQEEDFPRVLVMTTTAGGVSITLDRAETVIFTDHTWSPSDQIQARDRIIPSQDNLHKVQIYNVFAKESVDEYIRDINLDKHALHELVLDIRRKILG